MAKILVFILFVFYACGSNETSQVHQTWTERQKNDGWEEQWDGESWLGLVPETHILEKSCWDKHFLNFSNVVKRNYYIEDLTPTFQIGERRKKNLLYVRFRNFESINKNFSMFPISSRSLFADKQINFLKCLYKEMIFFEPNFYSKNEIRKKSESYQRTNFIMSPHFSNSSEEDSPQQILRRIKADIFIAKTEGKNRKNAVIAIADTGVDRDHPLLSGKIYKNEAEANGDPTKDNDGNGWIHDVYGIDATIPKGEVDKGPGPIPGSADLGGPGAQCVGNPALEVEVGRCGHGTHVAGIVAAEGSGMEPRGVCPNCLILPIRVTPRIVSPSGSLVNGRVPMIAQVRALSYVLDLLTPDKTSLVTHVVNLSLGQYRYSQTLAWQLSLLHRAGVAVVAAAGNDDTETPTYPAAYPTVYGVCATGSAAHRGELAKADYSNFGWGVSLCAPGTKITSTFPGLNPTGAGATATLSGTSQAAPFFAGAIGLLMGTQEGMRPLEAAETLLRYARDDIYNHPLNASYSRSLSNGKKLGLLGAGFLDLEAVLTKAKESVAYEWRQEEKSWSGCVANSIGKGSNEHGSVGFPLEYLVVLGLVLAKKVMKRRWSLSRKRIHFNS